MLNIQNLRILPRWIIITIDLGIFLFSITLGFLLRFNFDLGEIGGRNFYEASGMFMLANFIAILITKNYAGIIRYTGVQDTFRILGTTGLGMLLVIACDYLLAISLGYRIIPLSIIIISFLASTFFLVLYRFAVKIIFNYYSSKVRKSVNVIIFGAGEMGIMTKEILDNDKRSSHKVVGFVEDGEHKVGKKVGGVKIHSSSQLEPLFDELRVQEVIIAINMISRMRTVEIVDVCLKNNIKVRHVPPVQKWVKGELSLNQIKDVRIEDLLGREKITLNNIRVGNELFNRCVFITGAAGSIGSEIVRQVIEYKPSHIVLIDQNETGLYEVEMELSTLKSPINVKSVIADITNKHRIRSLYKNYLPDIVYHAAAYKHVPVMEKNPSEAVITNILGTKVLADCAHEFHTKKFVMISTDKAVNPTSVMGASKRIAELYVQSLNNFKVSDKEYYTRFVTTRFGNVLGSNGSVIPLFKRQISKGGPITVTHPEITRYFMTISEACQLVLEAGSMGNGGEIYIFDMGSSVKILDLAKKMVKLSGLNLGEDIEIQFTGLREGEKLYEELLLTNENTIPTHHEKILIAQVEEQPYMKVSQDIDKLIECAFKKNELDVVSRMKQMVPEYRSNISRFEALDHRKGS